MAVRTWAPRGQTPVLRVPLTRDHLSAISGITMDGQFFMQVRLASYTATGVVGFLRVLLRKIRWPILLIWDVSPIHRAHEVKDFLRREASKRLHQEVIRARERLRHKRDIIRNCSEQCGYLVWFIITRSVIMLSICLTKRTYQHTGQATSSSWPVTNNG
jgi:hypothetical protein